MCTVKRIVCHSQCIYSSVSIGTVISSYLIKDEKKRRKNKQKQDIAKQKLATVIKKEESEPSLFSY